MLYLPYVHFRYCVDPIIYVTLCSQTMAAHSSQSSSCVACLHGCLIIAMKAPATVRSFVADNSGTAANLCCYHHHYYTMYIFVILNPSRCLSVMIRTRGLEQKAKLTITSSWLYSIPPAALSAADIISQHTGTVRKCAEVSRPSPPQVGGG